jgi:tetratricopeptide (TPR) repeat protein
MKVQAAAQANNWAGIIQAVTDLLENFPDSPYKHRMIIEALQAAQNENSYEQIVVWSDRAIQDDPNEIFARVQLADSIVGQIHENDLDKADNLKKVDDNANQALTLLQNASTAPANAPINDPSQWPALKQELTGQANYALAGSAELKKNYPDAQKFFQLAIASEPTNATYYARLAKVDLAAKQYDDAIAAAQKAIDMPNAPAVVKQFAQQMKDRATALKGTAPK